MPRFRWRAAEAVGTCVQNNQKVQRVFQEGGVLPILLRLLSDPDATVITKALYALGSLVRNNREGLAALRAAAPHAALVGALKHADVRVRTDPDLCPVGLLLSTRLRIFAASTYT